MSNLEKLKLLVQQELSTLLCRAECPYDTYTLPVIDGEIQYLRWVLNRIDELIQGGSNE